MKKYTPYLIVMCAVVVAMFAFWGERGYTSLVGLRKSLATQRDKNTELRDRVLELKSEVAGLNSNNRTLEKAARNELGLAKPDEYLFIFDSK